MAPLPTIYVRESVASGADSLDERSVPGEAATTRPSSLEPRERIPELDEGTTLPPKFAGSDNAHDSPLSGYDISKRTLHAREDPLPDYIDHCELHGPGIKCVRKPGVPTGRPIIADPPGFFPYGYGPSETSNGLPVIGGPDLPVKDSRHSGPPSDVGQPYGGGPPSDVGQPYGGGPPSDIGRPSGGGRRPQPMTHDPAIDLTPGRVPMGEVGPPGPSFMNRYGNMIYIGLGVIAVAGAGYFGFNFWKKKKAAASEAAE
ncbi:hypothetical protein FPOAC2_08015 [Fusarium poae]|uniref:hypothetical protein n=1 Tax=Fusarium poae TaxID=36050 RepID=UPI001CE8B582|nr:hypothetical protein FPOAC1_008099 [Fusarium poae]KAG8668715.1 hypothetical protein FPOAC1_008099 [Fusarium poae]